jgi:L-seryl-tRNA(Ser) seleniumtransferase
LGGPQAGIIAGRADLIEKINANPIKRAVRSDKLTIAALSAVLKLYFDPDRLAARLPALRLLTRSYEDIFKIAEQIQPLVAESLKGIASVKIIDCKSQIGSGALPTNTLRSAGLAIKPIINGNLGEGRATKLLAGFAAHFRCLTMPVIGNLRNGSLLLDLRSLEAPEQLINQLPELCDKLGADK